MFVGVTVYYANSIHVTAKCENGRFQPTVYLYKLGTSKFQNASAEVSEFSQFGSVWAQNALGHFHPLTIYVVIVNNTVVITSYCLLPQNPR